MITKGKTLTIEIGSYLPNGVSKVVITISTLTVYLREGYKKTCSKCTSN